MILTNRTFKRNQPSKDAKSLYVFCEGAKREYQYFNFFKEIDSRINIVVYKLQEDENNSPKGLFEIAQKSVLKSPANPNPKYSFQKNDEVWLVMDIDKDKLNTRLPQIFSIRAKCEEYDSWYVTLSNPCFEVWLYYHLKDLKPRFKGDEYCTNWKSFVNEVVIGGFDSRRHPIFLGRAAEKAESSYESENDLPDIGSTEIFRLSRSIFPLVEKKIEGIITSYDL